MNQFPNVARLQQRINATKAPRLVYEAMLALAPLFKEARSQQGRAAILDALTAETEVTA